MTKEFGAVSRSHASHGAEKSSPPVGFDRGEKLKVLSLFAGIGGFDLGLERTGGFETVAFCEIDPFCQRVLAKHWPGVPCYDDVKTLTGERLAADGISANVIVGGFPCQNISQAGASWGVDTGIGGDRSGLWFEYGRLIGELRPQLVIVENVAALLDRGLGDVLGTLASLGYDAEWDCLPATLVGGRHPRKRLWLVSYPSRERLDWQHGQGQPEGYLGGIFDVVARSEPRPASAEDWVSEPAVSRVVDGFSAGMDRAERVSRTRALGNAVVPQIPELIGNAILTSLAEQEIAA